MPWASIPTRPCATPLGGWCRSARGVCGNRYLGSMPLSFINHAGALFSLTSSRDERKNDGGEKEETDREKRQGEETQRARDFRLLWLVRIGQNEECCTGEPSA